MKKELPSGIGFSWLFISTSESRRGRAESVGWRLGGDGSFLISPVSQTDNTFSNDDVSLEIFDARSNLACQVERFK